MTKLVSTSFGRDRQKVCSHCHGNQYCSPIPKVYFSSQYEVHLPSFLFYSLSEPPSISIGQSPSFLLFVLFSHIFRTCPNPFFSLFSLPSTATPWTTGAKVRHVLVCLSKWWIAVSHFIDGKHRLMVIFKAFTCIKIHRETPAKTLMSFSFNPRH